MKIAVKQIVKKQRLSKWDLIRFQILVWCFLKNIQITDTLLDMLSLLCITGKVDQSRFCEELVRKERSSGIKIKKEDGKDKEYKYIFNSVQSARNAIGKAIDLNLISREHKQHDIEINSELGIIIENNLLIDYQLLSIETD
jgi:hypothetical protein